MQIVMKLLIDSASLTVQIKQEYTTKLFCAHSLPFNYRVRAAIVISSINLLRFKIWPAPHT